jgi:hypothetical protein
MDALGITLAILIGLAVLVGIAIFGFAAWFIFKTFKKVSQGQKDFDRNWNNDSWNRFKK